MKTNQEIAQELAHRTCTKYHHVPDSSSIQYSFSARHLTDFVEKLIEAVDAERGKDAVGWMWQHEDTGNMGVVDQWQIDNGWEEGNPRIHLIGPLFLSPHDPDGMALVPIEPTEAMLISGRVADNDWLNSYDVDDTFESGLVAIYKAMIQAAVVTK